jgi:quercetin dioxygenase-like cupin family protein
MQYSLRTFKEVEKTRVVQEWGTLSWLAGKKIGNAQGVTVGRVIIKRGQSNPRHSHSNCEEVLYLLTGRLEHSMGENTMLLEAGDTLVVGAGVPHSAVSVGETDADMIVAYSSGNRDFVPES